MYQMKRTIETSSYVVYDDFLPPDLFEAMNTYCQEDSYRQVHEGWVNPVWTIDDGMPRRSRKRLMIGTTQDDAGRAKAAKFDG